MPRMLGLVARYADAYHTDMLLDVDDTQGVRGAVRHRRRRVREGRPRSRDAPPDLGLLARPRRASRTCRADRRAPFMHGSNRRDRRQAGRRSPRSASTTSRSGCTRGRCNRSSGSPRSSRPPTPCDGDSSRSVAELRARPGTKWHHYADDVLPAWIAEMDFDVGRADPGRHAADSSTARIRLRRPESDRPLADGVRRATCASGSTGRSAPTTSCPVADLVQALFAAVSVLRRAARVSWCRPRSTHPFSMRCRETGRRIVEHRLVDDGSRFVARHGALGDVFDQQAPLLLLCNPHNPTGRVFEREELRGDRRRAVERNLIVVADEVHADLIYPGISTSRSLRSARTSRRGRSPSTRPPRPTTSRPALRADALRLARAARTFPSVHSRIGWSAKSTGSASKQQSPPGATAALVNQVIGDPRKATDSRAPWPRSCQSSSTCRKPRTWPGWTAGAFRHCRVTVRIPARTRVDWVVRRCRIRPTARVASASISPPRQRSWTRPSNGWYQPFATIVRRPAPCATPGTAGPG